MRNRLRKPVKLLVSECLFRLKDMNNKLADFPVLGTVALDNYELSDIFYRIMPLKWRNQWKLSGKKALYASIEDFANYFEQVELVTGVEKAQSGSKPEKGEEKKRKKNYTPPNNNKLIKKKQKRMVSSAKCREANRPLM